MRAKVLLDAKGQVLSAVLGEGPMGDDKTVPVPAIGLLADDGQHVLEVGLSHDMYHQPLDVIVDRLGEEAKARQKSRK